jgi:DNA repair protein RadC
VSNLTIQELPRQERPREKLVARGTQALTDAEVLAILLRTGTRGQNAVELAGYLLAQYGSLGQVARAEVAELRRIKGIGSAKAIQLVAAFAVGSRLAAEQAGTECLDTPEAVYRLCAAELRLLDRESLRTILLDTRYRLITMCEISRGTLNESLAHPREIFKTAISHSAYAMVLVHNHPSGDPSPSEADLRLTRKLAEAARLLQINLLDHIIVGMEGRSRVGYFSFKEAGLLG